MGGIYSLDQLARAKATGTADPEAVRWFLDMLRALLVAEQLTRPPAP
jgi:hypothetical protein